MKKTFIALLASCSLAVSLSGCAATGAPILEPDQQINRGNALQKVGANKVVRLIPRKNEEGVYIGNLQASWNPSEDYKNQPTFIAVHGGHGIGGVEQENYLKLHKEFGYNLLILDSYWSRGMTENWNRSAKANASVRTHDIIAAAEWLRDVKGTDPGKTFIIGGSQGGWTVLTAMTAGNSTATKIKSLVSAGFAFYPVCDMGGMAPYHSPTFIFTGKLDETTHPSKCGYGVLRQATRHTNYPNAHHGFDVWKAPGQEACGKSLNPVKFTVCRDEEAIKDSYEQIRQHVNSVLLKK
jgi:dienelactone hydrolase